MVAYAYKEFSEWFSLTTFPYRSSRPSCSVCFASWHTQEWSRMHIVAVKSDLFESLLLQSRFTVSNTLQQVSVFGRGNCGPVPSVPISGSGHTPIQSNVVTLGDYGPSTLASKFFCRIFSFASSRIVCTALGSCCISKRVKPTWGWHHPTTATKCMMATRKLRVPSMLTTQAKQG